MDNKQRINVNVADRVYPLNILINEEELVRKAVEKINNIVLEYKNKFNKDNDTQDYLAMASLHFVTQLIKNETKQDLFPLIDEIKLLNIDLDEFIKNNKKDVL